METALLFLVPGLIFLVTLATGVWLSLSGKPLNTAIFTIHKLVALGAVIITIIQMVNLLKNTPLQGSVILWIIVAGLCVLALFATGALMSLGKPVNIVFLTIHRAAPLVEVIAMVVTIYLIAGQKL